MTKNFRVTRRRFFVFDTDYRFAVTRAIIHVSKHPYEQKTKEVDWNHFKTYISKFEYAITVDFLFFLARFKWIGREQNAEVALQD